jgi:hypothetical protein
VLQYVAGRLLGALDRLSRSTPSRLSSPAFLDCFALLHMIAGLVALVSIAVLAMQMGDLLLVLPGMALFILCQYSAILALNPDALALTITADATAGEEALGVLSFLVKAGARLVPVAFGVGVVWGIALFVQGLVLVFMPPRTLESLTRPGDPLRFLPAKLVATHAGLLVLVFALMPVLAYLAFLAYQFLVEVLRSILAIPGRLAEKNEDGE